MKKLMFTLLAATALFSCCCEKPEEKPIFTLIEKSMDHALEQSLFMARAIDTLEGRLPRTIDKYGSLVTSDSHWWYSGFFPGVLWFLYEYSDDEEIELYAKKFTARVEREKYTTTDHDVGFMLNCSFGNGLRIDSIETYKEVLLTGAKSLSTRFNETVGATRSWDFHKHLWDYPVIIDNLMNLELLMWAFKESGDSTFYNIAVSHADITMKNHFRDNYSTWHVVSYDTITGEPAIKQTNQGYSDDSAWARGTAWSLYGYTMMYRETGLERYLEQAKGIADFITNHPNMPADYIPYWDFDAPDQPNCYRDASAAAIIASALIKLSRYDQVNSKKYLDIAETQIRTLSSDEYTAPIGTNGGFILKHSVGSLPGGTEIDVPLTYADYYYLEAMLRYRKLLNDKFKNLSA